MKLIFRGLTDDEIKLGSRVEMGTRHKDFLKKISVAYFKQGNFWVCLLARNVNDFVEETKLMMGVTKRMVEDIDRPEHARRIALCKSVKELCSKLAAI